MKTFLVSPQSRLGMKVINYVNWKYNNTRSCCCITVTDCCIKVVTRCHKKDHWPVKLRNKYRRHAVHSEYVNQDQMNDLWSFPRKV